VETKKLGRPQKYDEDLKAVSIYAPTTFVESIKEEASNCQLSVNEYLNALIASADKKQAQELALALKEMRDELRSKTELLKQTNDELVRATNSSKNILNFVIEKVESDPFLDELIEKVIMKHKKLFIGLATNTGRVEAIEEVTQKVFADAEIELAEKGYLVKKQALIKAIIRKKLSKPSGDNS
jgi:hypothetical protein